MRVWVPITLALLTATSSGCQATPGHVEMQSTMAPALHRSDSDIVTVVMGATALSQTKPVRVTDEDLAEAMKASLERAGLFRRVVDDGPAQYHLHATVQQLEQDIFGMDMTAAIEVSYVLARMSPKGVVWEKTIRTFHTAGMKDGLISLTRIRVATEGASRKNIEQALQEIAALRLE